ncbi:hypothetical protein B0H11DRAFT_2431214 [Mycena galericulata]|nr:hypothetical protein B0H11DRAFT_2431214 [Mycena galericulata]
MTSPLTQTPSMQKIGMFLNVCCAVLTLSGSGDPEVEPLTSSLPVNEDHAYSGELVSAGISAKQVDGAVVFEDDLERARGTEFPIHGHGYSSMVPDEPSPPMGLSPFLLPVEHEFVGSPQKCFCTRNVKPKGKEDSPGQGLTSSGGYGVPGSSSTLVDIAVDSGEMLQPTRPSSPTSVTGDEYYQQGLVDLLPPQDPSGRFRFLEQTSGVHTFTDKGKQKGKQTSAEDRASAELGWPRGRNQPAVSTCRMILRSSSSKSLQNDPTPLGKSSSLRTLFAHAPDTYSVRQIPVEPEVPIPNPPQDVEYFYSLRLPPTNYDSLAEMTIQATQNKDTFPSVMWTDFASTRLQNTELTDPVCHEESMDSTKTLPLPKKGRKRTQEASTPHNEKHNLKKMRTESVELKSSCAPQQNHTLPPIIPGRVTRSTSAKHLEIAQGSSKTSGRFKCPHCSERYTKKSSMMRHLQKHSTGDGRKPFRCGNNGCSKSFKRKDTCLVHKKESCKFRALDLAGQSSKTLDVDSNLNHEDRPSYFLLSLGHLKIPQTATPAFRYNGSTIANTDSSFESGLHEVGLISCSSAYQLMSSWIVVILGLPARKEEEGPMLNMKKGYQERIHLTVVHGKFCLAWAVDIDDMPHIPREYRQLPPRPLLAPEGSYPSTRNDGVVPMNRHHSVKVEPVDSFRLRSPVSAEPDRPYYPSSFYGAVPDPGENSRRTPSRPLIAPDDLPVPAQPQRTNRNPFAPPLRPHTSMSMRRPNPTPQASVESYDRFNPEGTYNRQDCSRRSIESAGPSAGDSRRAGRRQVASEVKKEEIDW